MKKGAFSLFSNKGYRLTLASEMTSYQEKWLLFFIFSLFVITTRNVYTGDTGDYFKVLYPLVTEDFETIRNNSFAGLHYFHFRDSFLSIKEAFRNYPNSYTLITYLTAKIVRLFSNVFDVRLVAIGWKAVFFVSVVSLYKRITGSQRLSLLSAFIFLFAFVLLVSSSNIAFLTSFYPEQIALIAVIWIINYFVDSRENKAAGYGLLLSCLILSTAKVQYFYIPGLIMALVLFRREIRPFSKTSLILSLCFIQLVAIACMAASPSTGLNEYDATYFGSYLWLKNHGRNLNGIPNKDCIGVDAWGNRFDMNEGAILTSNTNCYEINKHVSFRDSLSVIKRNPDLIYRLITDKAIYELMDYDYFHVYKTTRILRDAEQRQSFYSKLTYLKDFAFRRIRLPMMFFLLLMGGILLRVDRKWSLVLLALAGISVSQFYVSFMGEGYRDFGKHVFLLNYSFDLFLFCFVALIGRKGISYLSFRPDSYQQ